MGRTETKLLIRSLIEEANEETRLHFESLGDGGYFYTEAQKQFALSQIDELGVRATARMLGIPRITIQRWCRKYHKRVKRCPDWVFEWAERRRKRREFWERRGYFN
jgi:hypothetical protein